MEINDKLLEIESLNKELDDLDVNLTEYINGFENKENQSESELEEFEKNIDFYLNEINSKINQINTILAITDAEKI